MTLPYRTGKQAAKTVAQERREAIGAFREQMPSMAQVLSNRLHTKIADPSFANDGELSVQFEFVHKNAYYATVWDTWFWNLKRLRRQLNKLVVQESKLDKRYLVIKVVRSSLNFPDGLTVTLTYWRYSD